MKHIAMLLTIRTLWGKALLKSIGAFNFKTLAELRRHKANVVVSKSLKWQITHYRIPVNYSVDGEIVAD